ncbi:hypothetical protein OXIME_001303 [Oxyplasma meridianum]|uniref:Transposase n=1 Tax=Oxyplasma meridianum TaxID=3073602 RepID=A0AAX4NGY2_9ARCH
MINSYLRNYNSPEWRVGKMVRKFDGQRSESLILPSVSRSLQIISWKYLTKIRKSFEGYDENLPLLNTT